VSPLWRDEVAIYLAPRKLALVRRTSGLERQVVAAIQFAIPAGTAADSGPLFACLADVLADPVWHDATARAVVADHPWVRFAIVPWPATRLDAAGRLTQARYVLGDAYGEAVADWDVTLADTPPGRPFVACAMPATLRTALEDALAPAHLSLRSLQPQLVVAFNARRHLLPVDDTWFVSLDEGALSAVHVSGGAWDRVYMARVSEDWIVELERLQAVGRLIRTAGAPSSLFVDAPAWMRRGAPANPGIEWLKEDVTDDAQTRELALLQRVYA
jgi:hypothetical protein